MNSHEWEPMRILLDLSKEVDHAFASLIHKRWGQVWRPNVDLRETAEEYIIEVDLPGVTPDKVEVRLGPYEVTVCGIRTATEWSASATQIHRERRVGSFCRTLHLACRIDLAPIEATLKDGVYRLRLRKLLPNSHRRRNEDK